MATMPDIKKAKQPTIIRIVNILIGRANRREVLTFLLFVLLSFFFWIVQTAREDNISEYYVDFSIEGQPQDKVFTTHVPSQLKVAIEDNNMNLLNYAYDDRLRKLTVNFDRYADATGNFRISAAELQSLLRTELNNSTRITSINPSLIDARFALTEGRKVLVKVDGQYIPDNNYRVRNIKITPDSVTINAPTAVLDTMRFVSTVFTKHTQMHDTITEKLSLNLPLGVKSTPAEVKVTVPVSQYVEKAFDNLRIKVLNVPRDRRLTIFPYVARTTCLVDCNFYASVEENHFELTVNYDSIHDEKQDRLPIEIRYTGPEQEVSNIEVSPKQVEFIIEKDYANSYYGRNW